MTVAGRLAKVRGLTLAGRWEVEERHARPRMRQRGVEYQDVEHGLRHATGCVVQANGRWKLTTTDLEGDELTLIAVVDDGVLVVTVF